MVSCPAPGDDVVLDLSARQPTWAFGAQQERQEVLRNAVGVAGHPFFAHRDRVGHEAAEECHGLAPPQPRQARQPVGRPEQVERVDPTHRLEQMVDLLREAAGFSGDLSGKQRFGQDLVGEHRHVAGDVGYDRQILVARGKRLGLLQHRGCESGDVAWCEDRRHRLARTPPDLALRREQPVAQDWPQNLLPDGRHAVVLRVVHQHVADQAGIIGNHQRPAGPVYRNPGLVV